MRISPSEINYANNKVSNPNPAVAAFSVKGNHLGPFSEIVLTNPRTIAPRGNPAQPFIIPATTSGPLSYSPLAQRLFERFAQTDINRIDLSQKDDFALISFSKATPFIGLSHTTSLKKAIWDYINQGNAMLLHEALKANIKNFADIVSRPVNPENDPLKSLLKDSFDRHVTPVLERDGGSMKLLDIKIADDGKIHTEIALMGSCNGCTSAQSETLNGAAAEIREVLAVKKKENPQNETIQRIDFLPIQTRSFTNLIVL